MVIKGAVTNSSFLKLSYPDILQQGLNRAAISVGQSRTRYSTAITTENRSISAAKPFSPAKTSFILLSSTCYSSPSHVNLDRLKYALQSTTYASRSAFCTINRPVPNSPPKPNPFFISNAKRDISISNHVCQAMKNPYEVLGVSQSADQKQIKSAYYSLVKKYHPDQNSSPDAAERFKEIQQAYEMLKDSNKRRQYDSNPAGYSADDPFGGAGSAHYSSHEDFVNDSNFTDWVNASSFFDELLRKSGYASAKTAVQANLQITFLDAALGKTVNVSIELDSPCERCKGRRADPSPGSSSVCRACNGAGILTQRRANFVSQTTCNSCNGIGSTIKKLCTKCSGHGVVKNKKPISVKIPPGIDDQTVIQQAVDNNLVNFVIHISKDRNFTRSGLDIVSKISVSFMQAALGDELNVKTIHGNRKINIAPGTNSHSTVKLPGMGIRKSNGNTGSHVFEIKINVPNSLTERQKTLIKQIYEEQPANSIETK